MAIFLCILGRFFWYKFRFTFTLCKLHIISFGGSRLRLRRGKNEQNFIVRRPDFGTTHPDLLGLLVAGTELTGSLQVMQLTVA